MDYIGLIFKFKGDRLLASQEKESQLKQKVKLGVKPFYQLSLIKINSTYIEIVDKFYGWKGALTAVVMVPFWMAGLFTIETIIDYFQQISLLSKAKGVEYSLALLGILLINIPFFYGIIWLLLKESFARTHYPIRLNRKNRMIHVFRLDGTVLNVPWDNVFFTLGLAGGTGLTTKWDIRGLVLGTDRETVLETFTLSMVSTDKTQLYQLWEFIRRYMEEGPQEIYSQVEFCLPIWDRRESYLFGFKRLLVNLNGLPIIQILMIPFLLVYSIGRVMAMWTSRIPKWPKTVEDACPIDPSDPYVKDYRTNL